MLSFRFWQHLRDRKLSSPRDVQLPPTQHRTILTIFRIMLHREPSVLLCCERHDEDRSTVKQCNAKQAGIVRQVYHHTQQPTTSSRPRLTHDLIHSFHLPNSFQSIWFKKCSEVSFTQLSTIAVQTVTAFFSLGNVCCYFHTDKVVVG